MQVCFFSFSCLICVTVARSCSALSPLKWFRGMFKDPLRNKRKSKRQREKQIYGRPRLAILREHAHARDFHGEAKHVRLSAAGYLAQRITRHECLGSCTERNPPVERQDMQSQHSSLHGRYDLNHSSSSLSPGMPQLPVPYLTIAKVLISETTFDAAYAFLQNRYC